MIRLCILCDGPTEVEFVNRCLEPYLRPSGVSAYGTVLSARSGRHRGGRVTVDRLAKKISLHYSEADRVSTLVDFYGFQDRAARTRAQLRENRNVPALLILQGQRDGRSLVSVDALDRPRPVVRVEERAALQHYSRWVVYTDQPITADGSNATRTCSTSTPTMLSTPLSA